MYVHMQGYLDAVSECGERLSPCFKLFAHVTFGPSLLMPHLAAGKPHSRRRTSCTLQHSQFRRCQSYTSDRIVLLDVVPVNAHPANLHLPLRRLEGLPGPHQTAEVPALKTNTLPRESCRMHQA